MSKSGDIGKQLQSGQGTHPGSPTKSPDTPEKQKLIQHDEAARALGSKIDQNDLKGGLTGTLIFSIFAAVIGGAFQFGYHIGCVNAPAGVIRQWYVESHKFTFGEHISISRIEEFHWPITVGIFAVGGMIGGLASGWMADRFGRKGGMLLTNIPVIISAILMAMTRYSGCYILMIVGRLLIGISAGLYSGLVPMYLTEISPINLRGAIGSVNQLGVTVAILVSQIVGLPQLLTTEERWPIIFGLTLLWSAIQLCTLPMCPESPKYNLIVKNRVIQAEKDLKKLRGKENVEAEMEQMKQEAAVVAETPKVSIPALFKGDLLWPMFIAIMMMLAQQLSGINAAMFYSSDIFRNAGLKGNDAAYATIGVGAVNVAMTVVSIFLVEHPKLGRRILLLIGMAGMLVSSVILVILIGLVNDSHVQGASYPAMISVFLFVIFFATGPGAIPWFFVSELFSSGARGGANSVAAMVNWSANVLVSVCFPILTKIMRQYVFLIFSCCLAFFIFFTIIYVPETKGRTVEEINAGFKKGKAVRQQK
ncbi:hypothetical protein AB6A40_005291 [Gnathostoma spinigerum]|uniref:Major facilitator superfamily (MFS) profile domain-containing protein n=1 Tax=Gnathostoma spinigerum TaxID=75299 RepID=A0ABD6EH79_9BILA